jgi:hypothetical protein
MAREAGTQTHLLARGVDHFLQREQPTTEIDLVLETLGTPLLGALDKDGDGDQVHEPLATSARRWRVLADLLDAGSEERLSGG